MIFEQCHNFYEAKVNFVWSMTRHHLTISKPHFASVENSWLVIYQKPCEHKVFKNDKWLRQKWVAWTYVALIITIKITSRQKTIRGYFYGAFFVGNCYENRENCFKIDKIPIIKMVKFYFYRSKAQFF